MKIIFSLFILGFSFGFGPCLASCGPILIPYVAANKKTLFNSLWVYVLFSSARILVYLVLALLIFSAGRFLTEKFLRDFSRYVFLLGGIFIMIIGLLTALGARMEYKSCQFLRRQLLERDKKSIFTLGLIIGLLPCAPLLALLSYIGLVSQSWYNSLFYSFVFGLGTFISPLLILVLLTGYLSNLFRYKKEIYERIFSALCGLIIVFLGLQLLKRAF